MIEHRERAALRQHWTRRIGRFQNSLEYRELMLDQTIGRSEGMHQFAAMHLFVSRNDGVDERNSDAASDVAQQIIEAAGIADLLIRKRSHGGSGERNEDHARAEAAEDDRPEERPGTDGEGYLAEPDAADGEDEEAGGDEPARIHTAW